MSNNNPLLIVDDDPLNTQTLAEIFTTAGYEVEVALSGEEALKIIDKIHFSCVLSDIKMEKMNGVELLRAVKLIQPAIPFILMTAYAIDDLLIEGIREGALVTLIKPLDIDLLLGHISRIVNAN